MVRSTSPVARTTRIPSAGSVANARSSGPSMSVYASFVAREARNPPCVGEVHPVGLSYVQGCSSRFRATEPARKMSIELLAPKRLNPDADRHHTTSATGCVLNGGLGFSHPQHSHFVMPGVNQRRASTDTEACQALRWGRGGP